MYLNPDKCKGFRISFTRNPEEFHAVVVEGKELDVVSSAKLLGLTISNNLKWNAHPILLRKLIRGYKLLSTNKTGTIVASRFSFFLYNVCTIYN